MTNDKAQMSQRDSFGIEAFGPELSFWALRFLSSQPWNLRSLSFWPWTKWRGRVPEIFRFPKLIGNRGPGLHPFCPPTLGGSEDTQSAWSVGYSEKFFS